MIAFPLGFGRADIPAADPRAGWHGDAVLLRHPQFGERRARVTVSAKQTAAMPFYVRSLSEADVPGVTALLCAVVLAASAAPAGARNVLMSASAA